MASYLAQQRVLKLLSYHGFEGNRMLKLAPRISEVPDLAGALQFWTTSLHVNTIDAHPEILLFKPHLFRDAFNNLTKVFGNNDIPKILNNSPQIMLEEWDDIKEKIDFAIYNIQALHKEIVYSRYLTYPMQHIKTRYNFLSRCGLYIHPHKKDRKRKYVMPLKTMIESSHGEILKMTGLLAEEYSTMQKLTAKEMEKEKRDLAYAKTQRKSELLSRRKQYFAYIPDNYEIDADDDDDDDDDEEGEEVGEKA